MAWYGMDRINRFLKKERRSGTRPVRRHHPGSSCFPDEDVSNQELEVGKVEGWIGNGKIGGTDNYGARVASEIRVEPLEHEFG